MTRPSVVWVTIDSVRADHTSLCGYRRETTPNLRAFAGEDGSHSFERCFAHGIWSLPSVASIFTGRYPSRHGVGLWNEVVPESVRTVPEMLSANGWRTAGVSVNSFFSPSTGLDRGFDSFTKVSRSDLLSSVGVRGALKYATVGRKYSGGLTRDLRKHYPDYIVQEVVKERLDELASGESPFFLAAHYQGAHHPYYPSMHFARAFADEYDVPPADAREIAFERTTDVYAEIAKGCPYSETEWDALVGMYDGLVRQSDALVGELLDYVDSELGDDVIVVVTSDHGDLLGEYGLLSHKLVVHDAVSRVPLVVSGVDGLSDATGGLVQHVDVMQTLLAELGLSSDALHGEDLRTERRERAVTQRGEETCRKTLEKVREYEPNYRNEHVHESMLTALRGEQYKYLESGDTERLYELPDETRDVSQAHPDVRDQFESELSAWFEEYGDPVEADSDAEFSEATRERLRQLGYVVE